MRSRCRWERFLALRPNCVVTIERVTGVSADPAETMLKGHDATPRGLLSNHFAAPERTLGEGRDLLWLFVLELSVQEPADTARPVRIDPDEESGSARRGLKLRIGA